MMKPDVAGINLGVFLLYKILLKKKIRVKKFCQCKEGQGWIFNSTSYSKRTATNSVSAVCLLHSNFQIKSKTSNKMQVTNFMEHSKIK